MNGALAVRNFRLLFGARATDAVLWIVAGWIFVTSLALASFAEVRGVRWRDELHAQPVAVS